ncbi:hypothetical protein ACFYWY_00015 [Streptomyces sp. NPDC002870]|uniref:hypothetical protein n=1 Tax=Streptomyces sp. NPDC002870 TaxID=3364666 RepID=UPI0036BA17BE
MGPHHRPHHRHPHRAHLRRTRGRHHRIRNRPVAITGSGDGTARVWDLTTGRTTATLTGHTGPVLTVATAHLGNRPVAITTSIDDAARVWDLTTASCLTVIDLPASPHCAEFPPDGTVVLGMDHEVVVLTLEPLLRRLR